MGDLISRKYLLNMCDAEEKAIGGDWDYNDLRTAIKLAPAVDAVPVVHSKWKMVGADKSGRGGTFVCLACDKCYPFTCDYCPNCGAKMGGDVE